MGDGVLVGRLDEDCNGSWVVTFFDKGVFIFANDVFIDVTRSSKDQVCSLTQIRSLFFSVLLEVAIGMVCQGHWSNTKANSKRRSSVVSSST